MRFHDAANRRYCENDAARLDYIVAAGPGITPIPFILLRGSRATGQIISRVQLESLKGRFMGCPAVVRVVFREQPDVPVLNGRLDDAKMRALLGGLAAIPTINHALLCGPVGIIDEVQAALADDRPGPEPYSLRTLQFGHSTPSFARVRPAQRRCTAFHSPDHCRRDQDEDPGPG